MKIPATFNELKTSIAKAMLFLNSFDKQMYNTCEVLMHTGLRYNELKTENWKQISDTSFIVYTSKTKSYRLIELDQLNEAFLSYFFNNDYSSLIIFQSTFRYRWLLACLPTFSTDTENDILSHIFRYYYIRKLKDAGMEIAEIMQKINHQDESTTSNYVSKNIYINK